MGREAMLQNLTWNGLDDKVKICELPKEKKSEIELMHMKFQAQNSIS